MPMMPSVDVEDQGKEFRLTVDLPGFNKADVNIEVGENSVLIHAKKSQAEEEKQKNYVRQGTDGADVLQKSGFARENQVR